MNHRCLALAIALILTGLGNVPLAHAQWTKMGSTDKGTYFLDNERLMPSKDRISFWYYFKPFNSVKSAKYPKYYAARKRVEVDCKTDHLFVKRIILFDEQNKPHADLRTYDEIQQFIVVTGDDDPLLETSPVVTMMNKVCGKPARPASSSIKPKKSAYTSGIKKSSKQKTAKKQYSKKQ